MKVLSASLRANSGGPIASNRRGPMGFSLELLLDYLPDSADYRYKKLTHNGLTYYAGIVDGIARFFCHNRRDEHG